MSALALVFMLAGSAPGALDRAVASYMALRREAGAGVAAPALDADLSARAAAQKRMAEAIGAKRRDARQGSVFTPETAAALRRLIQELAAANAASLHVDDGEEEGEGEDGAPHGHDLTINGRFPPGCAHEFPTALLHKLPTVPEPLRYRAAGRALVLWDEGADLVVDFLPNALPEP